MLIKVKESPPHLDTSSRNTESTQSREKFDRNYYLGNSPGCNEFAETKGRTIRDTRLTTLLDLGFLKEPKRTLDLGCGRGEITRQLARQGRNVIALDYSTAAIAIAESCFADEPELIPRVEFNCADATELDLPAPVGTVLAGDIIEHLSRSEVERMYANVARNLTPDGRFIVHTAPSIWYQTREYRRKPRGSD